MQQFATEAREGRYDYRFTDVPAGRYEVLAGSDADNDLFICDAGEACAAWLTLDRPKVLQLLEDVSGIDFPIDYRVTLPSLQAGSAAGITGGGRPAQARARPSEGIAN